jgi:hypothetical protein
MCVPVHFRCRPATEALVGEFACAEIPIVSLAGIIRSYHLAAAVSVHTSTPASGFGNITDFGIPGTTWFMILIAALRFGFYWVVKAYRKRQGIDIHLILREASLE